MTKPTKNRVYCPDIQRTKMLFKTQTKADRFIKFNESELRNNGTVRFKHLRSYYCQVCGGWHITHANLSEEEIKEKESRINDIITRATEDINREKKIKEEEKFDAYDFIKAFDLKSFGGKKKFRKYLSSNPDLIPDGVRKDLVFHVLKEMPVEYFRDIDFQEEPDLSEEEILKQAQDLYSELPFHKLKDSTMVKEYIKWEFKYKRETPTKVILKLEKLCGL